jgi:hypothetical protein
VGGGYAAVRRFDLCLGPLAPVRLFCLFMVADLRVDLVTRTYVRWPGWWPTHWRRRGPLDEIDSIQIRPSHRFPLKKVYPGKVGRERISVRQSSVG